MPEVKFLDDLSLNLWDCGGYFSCCQLLVRSDFDNSFSQARRVLGKLFPTQARYFCSCSMHDFCVQCGRKGDAGNKLQLIEFVGYCI